MKVALEPEVPYDKSVRWAMAEAYFERAGIAPWTTGAVPFRATSSLPAARQHALVVTRHFVELSQSGALGPDDKFVILEVGAGLGLFAQNFLRALDGHCGGEGKRLLQRLTYVFADFSRGEVCGALARPELLPHVGAGRITPALFDLRRPTELRDLDGAPLAPELTAPTVVIANYICCVLAPLLLRKEGDDYFEQHIALTTEVGDGEEADPEKLLRGYFDDPVGSRLLMHAGADWRWVKVALDDILPPQHAPVVAAVLRRFHDATLYYPRVFIEFIDALATRVAPRALLLVTDYGSSTDVDLDGRAPRAAQLYGNSTCNGVNFALFDALAKQRGWQLVRTYNVFRGVHATAIGFAGLSRGLRSAFGRAFVRHERGEDLIDFADAARLAHDARQYTTAARYYRRALRLDPDDLKLLLRWAEACIEGALPLGQLDHCYRRVLACRSDAPADLDFDFLLGRLANSLGRPADALRFYEASLANDLHPATLTNMGAVQLHQENFREAYRYGERALAVQPDYERAIDLLAEVKEEWTKKLAAEP